MVSADEADVIWWSSATLGAPHRFDNKTATEEPDHLGTWFVAEVHVDQLKKAIFFTAAGREPGIPYSGGCTA
jgi:hypothetical protein